MIPPLFARLVIRRNFSFLGILQDLFVGLQLSWMGPFAPLFHLLILSDAFLFRKLGYRIDAKAISFLKEIKSFKDSAESLGALKWLPLFCIIALAPLLISSPSPWVFIGIPLWFIPLKPREDSLVILWEKQLGEFLLKPFRKTKGSFLSFVQKEIISPTEVYTSLSKKCPLFRYTHGFKGEKLLNIRSGGKPHVIFLFFESLRQQNLHQLPHLNALSKECYTFPNFYSNSILTFRTFFTALYGLPYDLGITWGLDREIEIYGLPDVLKQEGYDTNFFKGATWSLNGAGPFLTKYGADRVFDRKEILKKYGEIDQGSWGVPDEYLLKFAVDHLDAHRESPQFYSLLTISSHHPWKVPSSYQGPSFEEVGGDYTPKYLQTLHYTDQCIGQFIQELKERNLSKDVILFITGDHGVYFGEGDKGHEYKRGTHQDNFHVPLMIYADGRIADPQEISTLGSHADLFPTLLDLFSLQGHQHSIGKSLLRKQTNPRIFYHNPSNLESQVCCRDRTGELEENAPVTQTFRSMMLSLFDKHLLVPKKEAIQRNSLQLTPFEPPITLSKETLLRKIELASPLVTLNLNRQNVIDDASLQTISKWNPTLTHLCVNQSYKVTDKGVNCLLQTCQALNSLDLSFCPLLTEKCLENLPQTFYELNLKGTDFAFQRKVKDLEVLNIQKTPLSPKELKNLPKLCPHLITLHLSAPPFTGKTIQNAIGPLPLYRLFLDECDHLTTSEAVPLFNPHPHLRFLFLERCHRLTDDLFQNIHASSLRHLTLIDLPHLTDTGLEALLHLPLDSLEIRGCPNLTDHAFTLIEKRQSAFSKLTVHR